MGHERGLCPLAGTTESVEIVELYPSGNARY